MKKIYILGTIALAVAAVFTSCSDDFLEEKTVYGKFSEDELYSTYAGAQDRVNNLYKIIMPRACQGNGNGSGEINNYTSTGSEDVWSKSSLEFGGFTDYINPDVTLDYQEVTDYFYVINDIYSPWGDIRTTNDIIEHVEASESLTEEEKNKLLGQAYFFRGFRYWMLVKLYGGVPIIDHVQNPVVGDGDGSDKVVPRSPAKDCIEFICNDLDKAAAMLPASWGSSDYGRITAGAAAALKGRILLFYASPLFNRKNNETRWTAAYEANKKAIELLTAGGVGLAYASNGGDHNGENWAKIFLNNEGSDGMTGEAVLVNLYNNREKVSSADYHLWNNWEHSLRPTNVNGAGGVFPTAEMVDLFPMADGTKPTTTTYDKNLFWLNRDPRFYRTFAFPGTEWLFTTNGIDLTATEENGDGTIKYKYSFFPYDRYSGSGNDFQLWSYTWYDKPEDQPGDGSISNGWTADKLGTKNHAIYLRKRSDDYKLNTNSPLYLFSTSANEPKGFQQCAQPLIIMRYAEVLLDFAEAAAGAGHYDEAYTALTQIRARVGHKPDNNYGLDVTAGSTKEEMLAAVLYERQIELAYEGKQFDDIRRWMLFDGGEGQEAINASWKLEKWGANTYSYLGVDKLNGTKRHNIVVYATAVADENNNSDPLLLTRPNALDLTENITTEEVTNNPTGAVAQLANFYTNNLKRKDVNADGNVVDKTIDFKPQYYFLGLKASAMQTNPTLLQTIGWTGFGGNNTFDPLAE